MSEYKMVLVGASDWLSSLADIVGYKAPARKAVKKQPEDDPISLGL